MVKKKNKSANVQNKDERNDLLMRKLSLGSTLRDSDDDDEEEEDDDDVDDEEEEEDDDDVDEDDDEEDEEASLLISSDEEEFLETQRISLPELIVKKLLQTTKRKLNEYHNENCAIVDDDDASKANPNPIIQSDAFSLKYQQNVEQRNVSEVKDDVVETRLMKTKVNNEVKIDDFPRPMLLPKLEPVSDEYKQTIVTKFPSEPAVKRRRGRPPKSKLTEANVQFEDAIDKTPKKNHSHTAIPTSSSNSKEAIIGRIGYYEEKESFVYQCTICNLNLLFFNDFRTYTQHLRTTHQMLKYFEDPIMVIIPQRKTARTQQSAQQKTTTTTTITTTVEVHEQANRVDLKVEDSNSTELNNQPKDDKENMVFQLYERNTEQISQDPYYTCGFVSLYDALTLSLNCKYCDCSHVQEELFKKHVLLEHQALLSSLSSNKKLSTVINHDDHVADNDNSINVLPPTMLKSSDILNPNNELLTTAQAPETPPPEEEELEKDKSHYDIAQEKIAISEKSLPNATLDGVQQFENRIITGQIVFPKDKQENNSVEKKQQSESGRILNENLEIEENVENAKILRDKSSGRHVLDKSKMNQLEADENIQSVVDEQSVSVTKETTYQNDAESKNRSDAMHLNEIQSNKSKERHRKRKGEKINPETEATAEPEIKRRTRGRPPKNQTQHTKIERNRASSEKTPTTQSSMEESTEKSRHESELTESKTINEESTLSLPARDQSKYATINKETTGKSTHTQRQRRNGRKQAKQLLSPPKEVEKQHIATSASVQVQEKQQQHDMEKTETTPSTQLPSNLNESEKLTKKRRREIRTSMDKAQNVQEIGQKTQKAQKEEKEEKLELDEKSEKEVGEKGEEGQEGAADGDGDEEEKEKDDTITNATENEQVNHNNIEALRGLNVKKSGRLFQRGKNSEFVCEICKKTYKKLSRLMEHIRLHTGELPYKCEKCGKKFRIKARLTDHMLRHLGTKKFKCNICDLALSTRQDLSQHRRHHTGIRPHVCSYCQKGFVRGSDLKIHLRIHTGEKPYVCDICNQSFRANQNLYIHKKSHLGVKDYKCECCDKAFMRKIDQRVHMRTHTGEKPYKCEICGRGFSSKYNVRTHIERFHVENANGTARKKGGGRKPNALRAELERQKELIEELRNQLAQHIKTEEKIQQQQQVLTPTPPPHPLPPATEIATTSGTAIGEIITLSNFELPVPMHGMPTAVQMPKTSTTILNSIDSSTSTSTSSSLQSTSILTTSPQLQLQKQNTTTTTTTIETKTDTLLIPAAPNTPPHDISILAVFTTQPHETVCMDNLSSNLQLPKATTISSAKKERKITSYFNVMGQKS